MFIELTQSHISEVIQLSNQVFGSDFISPNIFKTYISSPHKKAFILIKDNRIIGFITLEILTPTKVKEIILKENEWFYNLTKPFKKILLIKQVTVDISEQRKGLGGKLVQYAIEQTIHEIDLFLCLGWIKDNNIPIEKALLKNLFYKEIEIKKYWENDSLINKYNCTICGSPPCKCSAAVYIRHKKTD